MVVFRLVRVQESRGGSKTAAVKAFDDVLKTKPDDLPEALPIHPTK